jgi:hypothetical protein
MRLKHLIAALCLSAMAASHASVDSVVPNAFADNPGTGTFLGPLANSQRTYQLLIAESQLTEHLGRTITAIGFRLPASALDDWPAAEASFANYDIRLSGSVDPALRSLVFANNVVGDQMLVRSGPLSIGPGSFESGSSPNMFGLPLSFDSGYVYTGGNLLIEIRHTGFTGTSRSVDAMLATGGAAQGYGTLFSAAWTGNYAGVSGSQATSRCCRSAPSPSRPRCCCSRPAWPDCWCAGGCKPLETEAA